MKSFENIQSTLRLVDDMIALAIKGDEDREDSGCGKLYGTMLDLAFKLKRAAEEEKNAHLHKLTWAEEQ